MRVIHTTYSIEALLEFTDERLENMFVDPEGHRHDGNTVRDYLLGMWLTGAKVIRKQNGQNEFQRFPESYRICHGWDDVTGCPGHYGAENPKDFLDYQKTMLGHHYRFQVTSILRITIPFSRKVVRIKKKIYGKKYKGHPGLKGHHRRYCWQCGLRTWSKYDYVCGTCRGFHRIRIPHKKRYYPPGKGPPKKKYRISNWPAKVTQKL